MITRQELEQEVAELKRANRRLSGTLSIVLETLDSENVSTLFSRVLEQISVTMDAEGTLMYLAEPNGYHLRGSSSGVEGLRVPRFLPFDRVPDVLSLRAGSCLRMRVQPPSQQELRQGRLASRTVTDETSGETWGVQVDALPPFSSFYAAPVWFGNHVVALIVVGWRQAHPLVEEDAELLDSVAHYLSVQLVGAYSALRMQREGRLRNASSAIREHLLAQDVLTDESVTEALVQAARELSARLVMLEEHGAALAARIGEGEAQEVPLSGSMLVPRATAVADEVSVVAFDHQGELSSWLATHGLPCQGAFVDAGRIAGCRRACLMLRDLDEEPMDDLDLAFLRGVAHDLVMVAVGEEARSHDRRISQALQTGMKNELQQVEGITAEGLYSSATAAATVGGDFYDLVRLPDGHACVIMGDVSGKGVEAASVSAAVRTALAAYSWEGLAPARMVRLLNDFLLGFSRLETFATLFVGIIDLKGARLTYCSAGHPPALLMRHDRGELESLNVQSGVVGAFPDMRYQDGNVTLGVGDVLLLYTDGTTEARALDGRFFGEDGLHDAVMSHLDVPVPGLCAALLADLDAFTDRRLEDDVALVALRFDGLGVS